MKQTKYIISADWHLTHLKPRCRLDEDWGETQKNIINFIYDKADENDAELIIVGDLFDQACVKDWVKYMFLDIALRNYHNGLVKTYALAGNHELPHHNLKDISKSSFGVIMRSGAIRSLDQIGFAINFGQEFEDDLCKADKIFVHILAYEKVIPPYIDDATTAQELLDIFPNAKWIFTGDNHSKFIYKNNNRFVINPGCIIRQTADRINYQHSVYLVDFETGEIEEIEIPDKVEMVTDEYIKENKSRVDRIESFVSSLSLNRELTFNFIDNLVFAMKNNKEKLEKEVVDFIEELIEDIKIL